MNIPEDLKYTKDHEWVKTNGSLVTIGITDHAQSELGDIVFVDLPAVGKAIKQKETLCVVESTKAASDVYAPLSGTVAEVNQRLGDKPELINKNPYADGWMVKLKDAPETELQGLLSAADYKKFLENKA